MLLQAGMKNGAPQAEVQQKKTNIQEMLRLNRWQKTVNRIEALGGVPKINLDSLDKNQALWSNAALSGAPPAKKLRRSMKLHSTSGPAQRELTKLSGRGSSTQESLRAHEFKRYLSVEYDGNVLTGADTPGGSSTITLDQVPKFRRVSSFVGTDEGFKMFEASELFGKRTNSFESTESLVNPAVGGTMERTLSFKSAQSGENETLFDFSTTNAAQGDLILGALPTLPAKKKPSNEDKKGGEDAEGKGEGVEAKGGVKEGAAASAKREAPERSAAKSKTADDKESEAASSSSKKVEEEPVKEEMSKEEKAVAELVGPLEDKDGNMREYTRDEKRILLARYREKKRKRSFRKVIRYECRRRFAVSRPRIGGRFVKLNK